MKSILFGLNYKVLMSNVIYIRLYTNVPTENIGNVITKNYWV